uniref:Nicastrin n=1 Tax=Cyprinus carpio TaxID=7962 RepID=A0A8C1Z7A1_CYPCA
MSNNTVIVVSVLCSSVEQKIYVVLNETVPCVRLLNATHQIGCQSSISGDTGVLHVLETESDLDWILSSGPHPPYMVIMETAFFNRSVMMRMKNSSRVAGVAVIISKTGLADNFSPHTTCPNQNTGVYSESYGSDLANCNGTVWNPLGNGLSYEDFSFPVFALKDENQTQVLRKCYEDHNQRVNGSAPQYPLCAMQLFSHMHAVTDTVTCMRRTDLQNRFSINPEVLCDPLSDFNVWTSTRPLNNSAKGHAADESVVIAATRLDGRSFFWEQAPAAEGTVSGIVTLLATIQALYPVTQEAPPPRNIFFSFFQGEAFDYIGSSKMVYDMEKNDFVIDMNNVHSMLEIGQVGLRSGQRLWMHSDPVSRQNKSVDTEVSEEEGKLSLFSHALSLNHPSVSQPLPPSSFQRFLRARRIPGLVLADHNTSFTNRYYESMYDDAENLNVTYPPGLTPDEQLVYETDAAKVRNSC